jgi:hypothetical protein
MLRVLAITASFLGATIFADPVSAVTVSGQVVDEQGFGIFNVDLDFRDLGTGDIIFTPFDNTDAGGFYNVDVPVGEYEVTFSPPPGSPYLDRVIKPVVVNTNMTLDTFLWDAHLAIGTVQDEAGAPIQAVDLDFFDVATGDEYEANDDNTDPTGQFAVFVPALTYDVYFTPPGGLPKAATVLFNVAVSGTTSLGTITLADGFFVSGQVRGPGGMAIADADTDFEDLATGEVIFTPRDNTDGAGNLNVVVPAGTYDMTFKPPSASGLAWKTLYDLAVAANVNVGTVQLETGFAVTGVVRDELAQPVGGADLDMVDRPSGNDLPTPDDNTDGAGQFSLLSPVATFDLWVKPSPSANLAATVVRDVTVMGNLALGTITLEPGHIVSGVVRDIWGSPVAGVDLDAAELPTGLDHPTVGEDNTDTSGLYSIRLPAGSWTITAIPPPESGLLPRSIVVDPLEATTVIDFVLPSATVGANVGSTSPATELLANVPNPFQVSTRVRFELARAESDVRVSIFDLAGRRVRDLRSGPVGVGRHMVSWDSRDEFGRRVAAGVYLVRLEAGAQSLTRKITLLR